MRRLVSIVRGGNDAYITLTARTKDGYKVGFTGEGNTLEEAVHNILDNICNVVEMADPEAVKKHILLERNKRAKALPP